MIYIQAHGYTDTGAIIGGDYGIGSLTPDALINVLVVLGLDSKLQNIRIKVWACFSGFMFAEALYNEFVKKYPDAFEGLRVYGYKGETRATQPKKEVRKRVTNGVAIAPWIENADTDEQIVAARSKEGRVEFGPHQTSSKRRKVA